MGTAVLLVQQWIAEFLGTGFYTGSYLYATLEDKDVPAVTALSLVLAVLLWAYVSGAHYNPAVTLSFFLQPRSDDCTLEKTGRRSLVYMTAQIAGAVAGCFVVRSLYHSFTEDPFSDKAQGSAQLWFFLAEALGTFLLCSAWRKTDIAPLWLVVPLACYETMLFFHPISGGAFNPALVFGVVVSATRRARYTTLWQPLLVATGGHLLGTALSLLMAMLFDVSEVSPGLCCEKRSTKQKKLADLEHDTGKAKFDQVVEGISIIKLAP
ncbi:MAG: uncharacterized protein KVP18_001586 [Porospora cf. gigantea A]|uniref:uncharacterized protein n=1 Tax=Porospora cf. gigantea A TaxID=2853593 RepID=UPI0035597EE4|nr:MAG: hypothetical protein KVP18_001586 [Porospora cf. gigantea A]